MRTTQKWGGTTPQCGGTTPQCEVLEVEDTARPVDRDGRGKHGLRTTSLSGRGEVGKFVLNIANHLLRDRRGNVTGGRQVDLEASAVERVL